MVLFSSWDDCAAGIRRHLMWVVAVFERLRIPCLVGDLIALLGSGFYADAEMIREAIKQRGSLKLVCQSTMDKVDFFSSRGSASTRLE